MPSPTLRIQHRYSRSSLTEFGKQKLTVDKMYYYHTVTATAVKSEISKDEKDRKKLFHFLFILKVRIFTFVLLILKVSKTKDSIL